jgi:hypothetical protein
MPFVPVPDTALAEMRMLLDGQKIENTLWFNKPGGIGAGDMATLANALLVWWVGSYADLVAVAVTLSEVVVTDQSSAGGFQVSVDGGSEPGTASGTVMPSNAAFCISFRTGFTGRSNRGRNYISGLVDSFRSSQNTVTTTYANNVIAGYEDLITAAGGAGWNWVIASRFSGIDPTTKKPIPRTLGVVQEITNVIAADRSIDSQRRRLIGRGA